MNKYKFDLQLLAEDILDSDLTLDKATEELKPTQKKQWIKIFPKGSQFIEKYNKEFDFGNIEFTKEMERAFNSKTLSKPVIDKDHGFTKGDTKSYGKIHELKEDENWSYALVSLNKEGEQLVADEVYSYISPFCRPVKDTKQNFFPVKLTTLSLTNYPALEGALPDLQSQLAFDKEWVAQELGKNKTKGGPDMDLTMLAMTLNLSKESAIETIIETVKKLQLDKAEAEKEVIKLTNEIALDKKNKLESEGREFIKEQIRLGKMGCSEIVQKIELSNYIANPEERKEYFKAIPEKTFAIINPNGAIVDSQIPVIDGIALSKEDVEKMKEFDYDPKNPEDVKAYKTHYLDKKQKTKGGK